MIICPTLALAVQPAGAQNIKGVTSQAYCVKPATDVASTVLSGAGWPVSATKAAPKVSGTSTTRAVTRTNRASAGSTVVAVIAAVSLAGRSDRKVSA